MGCRVWADSPMHYRPTILLRKTRKPGFSPGYKGGWRGGVQTLGAFSGSPHTLGLPFSGDTPMSMKMGVPQNDPDIIYNSVPDVPCVICMYPGSPCEYQLFCRLPILFYVFQVHRHMHAWGFSFRSNTYRPKP